MGGSGNEGNCRTGLGFCLGLQSETETGKSRTEGNRQLVGHFLAINLQLMDAKWVSMAAACGCFVLLLPFVRLRQVFSLSLSNWQYTGTQPHTHILGHTCKLLVLTSRNQRKIGCNLILEFTKQKAIQMPLERSPKIELAKRKSKVGRGHGMRAEMGNWREY